MILKLILGNLGWWHSALSCVNNAHYCWGTWSHEMGTNGHETVWHSSHWSMTYLGRHHYGTPLTCTVPWRQLGFMALWSLHHSQIPPSAWKDWNCDSMDHDTCYELSRVQLVKSWTQVRCCVQCHDVDKVSLVVVVLLKNNQPTW